MVYSPSFTTQRHAALNTMQTSPPLSVTELTARIKQVLEQGFAQIQVSGEISRLTKPSSGHYYFTIKDSHAAISAVVWRSAALRLKTRPKEGQAYIFSGHLSLYEPRGSYQLVVQSIQAQGEGRLAAEFERRKQTLAERGWFESQRKLNIPTLPQRIAIITSTTAAALEDVKKVLSSRPAWLHITLFPCLVQGEQAIAEVVAAFSRVQQQTTMPDVILLVRGGGSMEDLWCFNDENIVKAIVDCPIPVISGIGHEIDTTLADLAADCRAATPSNAAELCCPSRETLRQQLPKKHVLSMLLQRQLQSQKQQEQQLQQRLTHHITRYKDDKYWSLERCNTRLQQYYRQYIQQQRRLLKQHNQRLQQLEPYQRLRQQTHHYYHLNQRLLHHANHIKLQQQQYYAAVQQRLLQQSYQSLHQQQQRWQALHEHLQALNPSHILQRGYAMTTNTQGQIITSSQGLHSNDLLQLHFHDGVADVSVQQVQTKELPQP
ncbi:MAG: exodeoxyribonuclease VII large subunit [Mariprofundaceae bacterium]|nr:exodeoxyribonuclease VII large subunit [Mariprofundaceae bacterium]